MTKLSEPFLIPQAAILNVESLLSESMSVNLARSNLMLLYYSTGGNFVDFSAKHLYQMSGCSMAPKINHYYMHKVKILSD